MMLIRLVIYNIGLETFPLPMGSSVVELMAKGKPCIKIKKDVIEDYSSQRDEDLIIDETNIFETIETLMDTKKYILFSQKAKKIVENNYNEARLKFAL